jgi:hypothetical protein
MNMPRLRALKPMGPNHFMAKCLSELRDHRCDAAARARASTGLFASLASRLW